MLVDSHCHLEYEGLVEDQHAVLDRARAAGVKQFLNISTRRSEWDRVVGTAEREADVWASIGIHPHEADQHADLGEGALVEASDHPRVVALEKPSVPVVLSLADQLKLEYTFTLAQAAS